ncbi:MAG: dihydrofolate reductase family protein, partial [Actinobacteria bacterium]|nr:dihydrofolate reductase family protein [Actinomycetota bacterium]
MFPGSRQNGSSPQSARRTAGCSPASTSARSRPGRHHDARGGRLHAWLAETPGESRAEVDQMTAAKAFIMGRNMFGPVRGEWDREWNGWWGDDPPFHAPVFVLTHYPRDPQPVDGGTTFHFVTGGIESALNTRVRSGRGRRRFHPGRRDHHQPVPRRRPDRRAAAAHRAV